MIRPLQTIEMKGVEVELLFTPSLYKRENIKGIDLVLHDREDTAEIWSLYVKHVYLAYLNAIDVKGYKGSKKRESNLTLLDFEEWAAGEGAQRFGELTMLLIEFKTGKSAEQVIAEQAEQNKQKKPQKKKSWLRSLFTRNGSREEIG